MFVILKKKERRSLFIIHHTVRNLKSLTSLSSSSSSFGYRSKLSVRRASRRLSGPGAGLCCVEQNRGKRITKISTKWVNVLESSRGKKRNKKVITGCLNIFPEKYYHYFRKLLSPWLSHDAGQLTLLCWHTFNDLCKIPGAYTATFIQSGISVTTSSWSSRAGVGPEFTLGTLGRMQEYTTDGMPVHLRVPLTCTCIHSHLREI